MENYSSPLCYLRQDNGDDFDWERGSLRTPSAQGRRTMTRVGGKLIPVTGPWKANTGKYYFYTEATGSHKDDVAR